MIFINTKISPQDAVKLIRFIKDQNLSGIDWKEDPTSGGGYFVSNAGHVVSLKHPEVYTISQWTQDGYRYVSLSHNNEDIKQLVHRLVARLFCEGYDEKKEVHHKDNNRGNNNYQNLQWLTHEEHTAIHQQPKRLEPKDYYNIPKK